MVSGDAFYLPRLLDLEQRLKDRSCFLFGPRQTGKSTLIRRTLARARVYNLLDSRVFLALARRPSLIREELGPDDRLVVIDEVQKLPELLDEAHLLIEERGVRFLLTGSSARKLKRAGTNLLGGRARTLAMHPLVFKEVADFDLLRAVNHGLLPSIYLSPSPDDGLRAYAGTYLREEVAAEAALRNIPAFGRFLEVAAICNGAILNHSRIASDAEVARSTVQEYFQILFDTFIASTLPAWRRTAKRKPIATSKLYFFDPGVVRILRNEGEIRARSPAFGHAFETFLFHELRTCLDYRGGGGALAYWRSTSNYEVDFVVNDVTAIEVKASGNVAERDLAGLRALREEGLLRDYVVVSLVDRPRTIDGIRILPWREFLERVWAGEFL
ncbi:MAG: ATP-binding protein [Deltaproteobacteria bacterium]|nr:ATP-binding protein [Deltaproteobacteria bacterium]